MNGLIFDCANTLAFRFNYEFLYKVLLSRSAEQLSSGFPRYGSGSRFVGMGVAINA